MPFINSNPRTCIAFTIELVLILFLFHLARTYTFGTPAYETTQFQPTPDMPEQTYMAWSMAHGRGLLIPVGHELHPSRYSSLHPWVLSLWIRIHGGGLYSIFTYPPAALLYGLVLLWITLLRWRWPAAAQLLAITIILFSQIFFDIARHVLQEPTLWLIFTITLAIYPWCAGASPAGASAPRSRIYSLLKYSALIITGIAAGTLIAIRPTLAPWPALILANTIFSHRTKQQRLIGTVALLFGLVIPLTIALAIGHHQFGHFALTGYHYWIPEMYGGKIFALENLWHPPVNRPTDHSNFHYNFNAFFGTNAEITTLGPIACWLLFIGFFGGGILMLRRLYRAHALSQIFHHPPILLGLFALAQFFIHNLYQFQAPRFFILGWPAFALSSIAGWMHIMRIARLKFTHHPRIVWPAFQVILVALILGSNPAAWTQLIALQQPTPQELRSGPAILNAQARAARRLEGFTGPLAVLDLPTLNARLILGLPASSAPVIPLLAPPRPDWDPHLDPTMGKRLPEPKAKLANWDWPAWLDGLYTTQENLLIDRQLEALKKYPEGFAIYFPAWKEATATPVLFALRDAGWKLEDATIEKQSRLFLVTR